MTLGRVAPCEVVIDDEKVSRKHARIVFSGGVAEVEDLGSRNGVFLNGNRVLRRVLRDGDVLTIGRVELTFRDQSAQLHPVVGTRPAGPGAGEDLLADDESAIDLTPAAMPRQPPAPERAPAASSERRESVQREPTPAPPPPGDVEVLEFVDEVVEVRKRPERERPGSTAPTAGPAVVKRSGVLQFSKQAQGGTFAEDVAQLGGQRRLLVILVGLACAVGVGWLAMTLTA